LAFLEKDAPPDVLETLRQAEAGADECGRGLGLRNTAETGKSE
jgi:hypothetical protein